MSNEIFKQACKNNNLDEICKIASQRGYNWVLREACVERCINIINLAIEKGANDFDQALYGACEGGNMEIVNLMIEKGAKIGYSILFWACLGGHIEIINLMIKKGAKNFNDGFYGACQGGDMRIVELMIGKGANDFNLGLYGACLRGHMNIVLYMIEKGANNYNQGLLQACWIGHLEIVNLMVEKGATKFSSGLSITSKIKNYGGHNFEQSKQYNKIINIMIINGAKIRLLDLKQFGDNNMLCAIIHLSKIKEYNNNIKTIISINDALQKICPSNESVNELIIDYQKNKYSIWKPYRHHLFPSKIKDNILHFMMSIKIFAREILKNKIPKPLLWLIINQFIWNN